jgi:putative nucleotidyltransferase with HDIG domain
MMRGAGELRAGNTTSEQAEAENEARLELIYEVSKKVGSVPRMAQLLHQVIEMTQQTLNAAAASVLLFDDKNQELSFELASGPVKGALTEVQVNKQFGIAGWVARNGKPLIVNDVSRDRRFNTGVDKTTGFVTKSIICVPLQVNRRTIGVIEVINKLDGSDFNERDLAAVVSVAGTAAMAIENTRLHEVILDAYKGTIKALAAAIDAKDPYTRGHSQRVMEYALAVGEHLSLPPDEMETLEYAGILHDVGKIAVDACILNKPSSLTASEWNIIREHPVIGANLLKEIPFLEKASQLVLHHHEKYDGGGYPFGLKGEDIPMGACIIAVADAFDTMTTDRSYRSALSFEHAIAEVQRCSGTQFCPVAAEAFIATIGKNKDKPSTEPAKPEPAVKAKTERQGVVSRP